MLEGKRKHWGIGYALESTNYVYNDTSHLYGQVNMHIIKLGVKVGTEIPSSSTLIFSHQIFGYSSILHHLKIAHQGP